MAQLDPGSVIAGYRIEAVAGRGGMGVVYRATQLALARDVALKVIAPDLADDVVFRERFERESHTAASIDHPNVLPVFEAGESDGQLFISMRYVDGMDMRELIVANGKLEPRRAVAIVEQVAAALDAAHRRGLVHRDVKPANVLLADGGEGHVYLTDFGLTKRSASVGGPTATGQFMGTPDYTAPEQIRGERADARTDVYALGCVLFQALTGSVPFERDTEVAKIYAHLTDPPPSIGADVPRPLDEVVRRALAKDPADRYQSAGDLGRAARAALADARPPEAERTVATGAAAPTVAAATAAGGAPTAAAAPPESPTPPTAPVAPERGYVPETPPGAAPGRRRARRPLRIVLAAVAIAGVAAAALVAAGVFGSGEDDEQPSASGGSATRQQSTPEVTASIRVGAGPDGITVSNGTVWVTLAQNTSVTPIDPGTNRARETVPVGANPDGVAGEDDTVWVALTDDDAVRRIENASGTPVAGASAAVGDRPEGLSLGPQLVWVANSGSDTVSRIDRASATPLGAPIGVGTRPIGVFAGESAVWVTNNGDDTVTRLDPASSETLGAPVKVGDAPRGVVEGGGSAWVANSGDGTVSRLDAASGRVLGRPIQVGANARDIAFGEGFVWVTSRDENTVTRIDPETGRVAGKPIPVGTEPLGVAVGAGAVWVANFRDDTVTRIDP